MITDSLMSYTNSMWGAMSLSSPVNAGSPAPRQATSEGGSLLGKRDADGAPRRRHGTTRPGSRYRGVTHHARTNRYEAHLWDEGKQLYLGGFYNEEQAALAYDLAAIRFRGEDACTNFGMERYCHELAARREVTREQVVACLRDQSKAMNKVDAGVGAEAGAAAPWEVALSAAVALDKIHLGVYGSELEAARAYDRALVGAHGLESTQMLNFPLVEYIDALNVEQRAAGMERGLLPTVMAHTFAPSAMPQPLVDCGLGMFAPSGYLPALSSPEENASPVHDGGGTGCPAGVAPPGQVPRRKSITPRSVLDFEDFQLQQPQQQAGEGKAVASQRQPLAEMDWLDALTL